MTIEKMRILAIAGSLRTGSYNRGLIRAAQELAPPSASIETFDLRGVPMYDGDVEAQGDPEPVKALKEAVRAADALLLVTPDYNGGMPAALKNAIDWSSRSPSGPAASAIAGKPVAIMGGGGGGGTARSQAQLRQVLAALGIEALARPEVRVANVWEKFDPSGRLVDQATREEINQLLVTLVRHASRPQLVAA